jgi:hypothetical protein
MAWAVTFEQDTDVNGEGTLTATNNGFSFSRRIRTNNETRVNEFVADAKARYAVYATKNADKATIAAAVLAKLEA